MASCSPIASAKAAPGDVDDVSTCCGSSVASTPAASGVVGREAQGPALAVELTKSFFALLQSLEFCPAALRSKALAEDPGCKHGAAALLRRCFALLSRAGHCRESLEATASHAAAYLCRLNRALHVEGAKEMSTKESSYVACVMLFLAHSHVEDVNLPLRHWHKYVFAGYCPLDTLNAVILSIMRKIDYKLMVSADELEAFLMRFFSNGI